MAFTCNKCGGEQRIVAGSAEKRGAKLLREVLDCGNNCPTDYVFSEIKPTAII